MNLPHDILLALAYVSQISDFDSVRSRFFESLNGRDHGVIFESADHLPEGIPEHRVFPITALHSSFGYAVIDEAHEPDAEQRAIFRNAFRFLAVLLENREQARALKARNETFRRQVEASLASNDTLLRIAGETANFGGWSVDLRNNLCTWSDKVADIHEMPRGYSPPVEDGINFYALEWRDKITQVFTDCAENGIPYDEEMEIITASGRRGWVRTTGKALRDEKGKIVKVQGAFQDISDRKRSEIKIKESEEKFRNLFENSTIGKSLTDLNGNVNVNKAFRDLVGYSEEELKNIKWVEITHSDDIRISNDIITSLLDGSISVGRFEKRYIHKTGTIVWADVSTYLQRDNQGEPQFFITSVLDITERKVLENELRESRAFLQAAMDNSSAGIAIADAPDGKLRYVNDAGLLIRGGDRQAIVDGVGIDKYVESWQLLDLEGRPLKSDDVPLARALMFGENSSREFIVRRADDDDRIVSGDAAPIKDGAGNVVAAIVIFTDITERKQAEEELLRLKDNLAKEVAVKTRELKTRVAELERFHDATIEREFRIKELRDEVDRLKGGST